MPPIVIGLIEVAICAAAFFGLGAAGWIARSRADACVVPRPGEAHDACFCETQRPGMIKQPSNVASNLGFVLVGLVLLAGLPAAVAGSGVDPMEEQTAYSVVFGCVVVFLGPGSMFFHASMKKWGGWIDTFSMILFTGFLFSYDLVGMLGGGELPFFLVWIGIAVALGVLSWFVEHGPVGGLSMGTFAFAVLAGAWFAMQVVILIPGGQLDRDIGNGVLLLIAAALVFASAFAIQRKSQSGGPWCEPNAVIQGHAIWHLLAAAVTAILFIYLQTEIGAR